MSPRSETVDEARSSRGDDLRQSHHGFTWSAACLGKKERKTSHCFSLSASRSSNQSRFDDVLRVCRKLGWKRHPRLPPATSLAITPTEKRATCRNLSAITVYTPSSLSDIYWLLFIIRRIILEPRVFYLLFFRCLEKKKEEKQNGEEQDCVAMLVISSSPRLSAAGLKTWEPFGSRDWMRLGKR